MIKTLLLLFFISCSRFQESENIKRRAPASFKSAFDQVQEKIEIRDASENIQGMKRALRFEVFNRVFGNKNLINIHQETNADQIEAHNKLVRDMLAIPPLDDLGEVPYVSLEEAQKIYQAIIDSTVVVNKATYDPKGNEGFCYGRAIIGHVEAVMHGLDPRSVKKIWTIGNWSHYPFHVAILLRAKKGWYAIDRTYLGVISAEEWLERSIPSEIAGDKANMIFVTDGERFSLNNALAYRSIDFFSTHNEIYDRENDFYRGYFKDFFEELDQQHITPFAPKKIDSTLPSLFIQYDIAKNLKRLYPHALSRREWKKLFLELDDFLKKNESELKKMTDIDQVLKYQLMLLDVASYLNRPTDQFERNIRSMEILVELSKHLESIYGPTNSEVKKTLEKLYDLPIEKVDRYLKNLLSLQINRKLSFELVSHYIGNGVLSKKNPHYQEIVNLILEKNYFDEKIQEVVKKKEQLKMTEDCPALLFPFLHPL